MNGFIKEDLIEQDIYINTFSQKRSGNDTDFIVETGQTLHDVMALELNTFRMINFLTNFDNGAQNDFRDFGLIVDGVSYSVQATQYYQNIQIFFQWLNTQISPIVATYSINNIFAYLIQDLSFQGNQFTLTGAGWSKLGFRVGGQQTSLNAGSAYDLSQSCMINIYIDALPSSIICAQGAISFTVANTSSFGSVLTYESQIAGGNKKMTFSSPVNIPSLLHIQLQNEEQRQLSTVQGNNASVNQTDLECILVMKAWLRSR